MKSQVSIPDDKISSTSQLASMATDLTDEEVKKIGFVANGIIRRYAMRRNTVENLEEMRDELLTKLAEINILATVDPTPVFYGEPPLLDILGHVSQTHGGMFDHEKKQHEVQKAVELNEDYRGQKEPERKIKKG